MLLGIDVGNTQTVIGVYADDTIIARWRTATDRNLTPDDLRMCVWSLLTLGNLKAKDVETTVLASVVPQLKQAWSAGLKDLFSKEPLICSAETAGELFTTDYPHPHEIGADRIADAVAARALYGSPVVVVDFGTATNMEVIDERGIFRGGIIAPGINTSANALFSRGAQLPAIDLVAPPDVIGRSTVEAIQAGIVLGECDRVDGLVTRIFEQLGYEACVVATGGLAPMMAPYSRTINIVNSDLTLEGLRLIAQLCSQRTS